MMGKVIEIAIKASFRNHIHTFRIELYRQKKGGAIGLRLTRFIARIVMDKWVARFREALKSGKVREYLLEKYVDDVNLVTSVIEEGW